MIDDYIRAERLEDIDFEEHESGPELLVYLSVGAAVVSLAANAINIITTIIKARAEGIRQGDHPHEPIELIVRSFDHGSLEEEKVLRFRPHDEVDAKLIAAALQKVAKKICGQRAIGKGKKRKSAE